MKGRENEYTGMTYDQSYVLKNGKKWYQVSIQFYDDHYLLRPEFDIETATSDLTNKFEFENVVVTATKLRTTVRNGLLSIGINLIPTERKSAIVDERQYKELADYLFNHLPSKVEKRKGVSSH